MRDYSSGLGQHAVEKLVPASPSPAELERIFARILSRIRSGRTPDESARHASAVTGGVEVVARNGQQPFG